MEKNPLIDMWNLKHLVVLYKSKKRLHEHITSKMYSRIDLIVCFFVRKGNQRILNFKFTKYNNFRMCNVVIDCC